jgi:probable rRNA maturation factor
VSIEVIENDDGWEALSLEDLCETVLTAVRDETSDPRLSKSVSALFTDDRTVAALNSEWRGKDGPTNVLSFPAEPIPGLPDDMQPLGDVALASGVCAREAAEKQASFHDHTAHLLVHGLLHLLGYDHVEDEDAERMEDLERRILQRLGIADPY